MMSKLSKISKLINSGNKDDLDKFITENEFDIDVPYDYPIGCEYFVGKFKGYKFLKKASYKFYIKDNDKSYGNSIMWTLLHYSAALGKQNIVDFLIEKGAGSIEDCTGRTSQSVACILKQTITVKIINKKIFSQLSSGNFTDVIFSFKSHPQKRKISENSVENSNKKVK
jgi:hypothetical protein